MKTKADEADAEMAKGSITEAIGKITASPSTENKGAAMKEAAQHQLHVHVASDMSGGDAKSTLDVAMPSSTDQVEIRQTDVVSLVEETARIDKRVVETGRVRVSTRTEVSEETLRESLRSDAVAVTRVPIDRVIADGDPMPQVRTEDGVTIIPVLEEILVVEKRLVLKEELHLRQTSSAEDVEVPVTVRRQHAVVEHFPAASDVEGLSRKEMDT